jgi:hypothetical protein
MNKMRNLKFYIYNKWTILRLIVSQVYFCWLCLLFFWWLVICNVKCHSVISKLCDFNNLKICYLRESPRSTNFGVWYCINKKRRKIDFRLSKYIFNFKSISVCRYKNWLKLQVIFQFYSKCLITVFHYFIPL